MAPNDPFSPPSFGKILLSFGIGIGVGLAIVLPVIHDDLGTTTLGDPGPIGNVLLIGVLSLTVVTTGLFALYQLFWLADR